MRIILFFLLISQSVFSQELIQNDFEKGYVKDGKKISVWQYFNDKKEPELVINHTTGKVIFIGKDTTSYFIYKENQWVASKLDVHPIPIEGSQNFYLSINDKIAYPGESFINDIQGKVIAIFDVDTLGNSSNYSIAKSIGKDCDSTVLQTLKTIDSKWIPAKVGGKKYITRFAVEVEFRLVEDQPPPEHKDFSTKQAKLLTLVIVPIDKVIPVVDTPAELIGGLNEFYKFIGKSIRYPPDARRMGVEGRVFVKFIIEPSGEITNVWAVKGFDKSCDQEAMRVVKLMPKWKPATKDGRPARDSIILPITFQLSDILRNKN